MWQRITVEVPSHYRQRTISIFQTSFALKKNGLSLFQKKLQPKYCWACKLLPSKDVTSNYWCWIDPALFALYIFKINFILYWGNYVPWLYSHEILVHWMKRLYHEKAVGILLPTCQKIFPFPIWQKSWFAISPQPLGHKAHISNVRWMPNSL